jgi:hypothetical protein
LGTTTKILPMKAGAAEAREPYEQLLLMFWELHHDLRRVENAAAQFINQTGVSWDKIGEVVGLTDEGARKHYTVDEPGSRPRRRPEKA